MRQQNLAKDAYKDPKNAEMIRKLESLEIKDGKIILKVRAKPAVRAPVRRPRRRTTPVEVVPRRKSGQPKGEPSKNGAPKDEGRTRPAPATAPAPKS